MQISSPEAMKDLLMKVTSPAHIQRGHSVQTMLTRYDINDLNLKKVDQFLLACCFNFTQDWREYLLHGTCMDLSTTASMSKTTGTTTKASTTPTSPSLHHVPLLITADKPRVVMESVESLERVADDDVRLLISMLHELYPPTELTATQFRSLDQRNMLIKVLGSIKNVEDHLFILPTGGGKSAAFGVSALYERSVDSERVTLVICPVIALCFDMERQLQEMGVKASFVRSSTTQYKEITRLEVLILLPEVAASNLMFMMLKRCHDERRLGAIFFDEFHVYYSWISIRPVMLQLVKKTRVFVESPRLMMSGTFPPLMQRTLQLSHPSLAGVTVNRCITDRPAIHFLRLMIPSSSCQSMPLILKAVAITIAVMRSLEEGSRVIISCSLLQDVTSVVHQLTKAGVQALQYDGSMSDEEKAKSYSQWSDAAASLVMVATSAFGIGTDNVIM